MLDYIIKSLPVFALEFFAALTGVWYLKRTVNPGNETKILVGFLWFNLFIEISGLYTVYAYYTNYEFFGFIKGTVFQRNYWLYNIRNVIEYLVFIVFFLSQLKNSKFKNILKPLALLMVPAMVLNLILSDVYFKSYSQLTSLITTFIYLILIFRYFYEMLQSERILYFYRLLPFYIAIGIILWHLSITPFLLYSKYYEAPNREFVEIQRIILQSMNIFMYSCFIIGFIICSHKRGADKKIVEVN